MGAAETHTDADTFEAGMTGGDATKLPILVLAINPMPHDAFKSNILQESLFQRSEGLLKASE